MNEKYITVTALTKYIKKKMDIDPHLQKVWLKGEISNFKHHSRGHMYLTIKDEQSKIPAVMFSGDNRLLKYRPENGMKVLIHGEVTVFETYGQYQLYIRDMQPDGIGALYLAYEQLKEKLSEQGYFANERKKEIVKYPTHIGVITSPTGAAVRDIITTIKRRFPLVQITIIPVLVQGSEAITSISKAIYKANKLFDFDTLIVGRGGGSIEDLWAFNDEKVAKAIFHSNIPVISGIGHETDITICDFTADLRAATPTGAAELAVPSIMELQTTIQHYRSRLIKLSQYIWLGKREKLQSLQQSYGFHKPTQLLQEKEQTIDRLSDELIIHMKRIQQEKINDVKQLKMRLQHKNPKQVYLDAQKNVRELKQQQCKHADSLITNKRRQLELLLHKLILLNPLEIMKRGFAIPYSTDRKIIKSTKLLNKNDSITLKMADGEISCSINEIWRDDDHGRGKQ